MLKLFILSLLIFLFCAQIYADPFDYRRPLPRQLVPGDRISISYDDYSPTFEVNLIVQNDHIDKEGGGNVIIHVKLTEFLVIGLNSMANGQWMSNGDNGGYNSGVIWCGFTSSCDNGVHISVSISDSQHYDVDFTDNNDVHFHRTNQTVCNNDCQEKYGTSDPIGRITTLQVKGDASGVNIMLIYDDSRGQRIYHMYEE